MAKWSNLAKRMPRFSIKDLLIVVACCSIGLSTQFDPLVGIASCFLLVELWRQLRFLRAQPPVEDVELQAGMTWARTARVLCAFSLVSMMAFQMLIMKGVLELPETELFSAWPLSYDLPIVLFIFALLLTCCGTSYPSSRYLVRSLIFGIIAILLLTRIVTREILVAFLTHRGVEGIEHALPPRLHRPGVYPDHAAEMYFTIWLGTIAAIALIVAAILILLASRCVRQRRSVPKRLYFAFASLLLICLGYVIWFYGWEYHRLSPDLASAGFAANGTDWLGGTLIGLVIVTGVASVLSRIDRPESLSEDYLKMECMQPSLFGLLAIGSLLLSFPVFCWEFVSETLGYSSGLWRNPILDLIDFLISPRPLLNLSMYLIAIQFAWRWLRSGLPEICVAGMNAKAFALNWIAILVLAGIGVPLLNAFAFVFWMGPWSPY